MSIKKIQQMDLEEHELGAQGGLVHVHERRQFRQRNRRVQLEQLLEAGQVALLRDQAQEAAQLQPVRLLFWQQNRAPRSGYVPM